MFSKKPEPTIQDVLDKFGLDLENYSKEQIKEENVKNIQQIARDMKGNRLIRAGLAFSFGSNAEKAQLAYLSILVEQNWIIMRQNELIVKTLEK